MNKKIEMLNKQTKKKLINKKKEWLIKRREIDLKVEKGEKEEVEVDRKEEVGVEVERGEEEKGVEVEGERGGRGKGVGAERKGGRKRRWSIES